MSLTIEYFSWVLFGDPLLSVSLDIFLSWSNGSQKNLSAVRILESEVEKDGDLQLSGCISLIISSVFKMRFQPLAPSPESSAFQGLTLQTSVRAGKGQILSLVRYQMQEGVWKFLNNF